jgi:hypothetical protein
VSIDQHDPEEKHVQVALMAGIYRRAREVIFWVGSGRSSAYEPVLRGFKSVRMFRRKLYHHCEIALLEEVREHILNSVPWKEWDPEVAHAFGDLTCNQNLRNKYGTQDDGWFDIHTIGESFRLPKYRGRLWIFQEVLSAHRLILLCGYQTIEWEEVQLIISWFLAVHKRY